MLKRRERVRDAVAEWWWGVGRGRKVEDLESTRISPRTQAIVEPPVESYG
jgi:hypothetical protein